MKNHIHDIHPSAELLQALLDGELPEGNEPAVREHLESCARCSAALDGWRVLFDDLGTLGRHPAPTTLAARVMAELPGVVRLAGEHPSEAALQDFVEGVLTRREHARVERHVSTCAPCTSEAEAWLTVMGRLEGLERYAPRPGFADRVFDSVAIGSPHPVAARLRAGVRALFGGDRPEHVPAGLLQDFVEGALPTPAVARIEAHLDSCGTCAGEATAWHRTLARLEGLERFAPADGFDARVMAALRARRLRVETPASVRDRALAVARSLVPRTRRAWAALSGAAVTPAVVTGLVVYVVFSHPTLTLGSLASFAWWQVADLGGAALGGVGSLLLGAVNASGLYAMVDLLSSAPAVAAGGVLAYSMICALALRVLYKHLFANRTSGSRYAHGSATP